MLVQHKSSLSLKGLCSVAHLPKIKKNKPVLRALHMQGVIMNYFVYILGQNKSSHDGMMNEAF